MSEHTLDYEFRNPTAPNPKCEWEIRPAFFIQLDVSKKCPKSIYRLHPSQVVW